jgi:CHAD domain-containing protein
VISKQISKLRKRAGKVRDCDVLTDFVSGVHWDRSESECSVRLLEHLGAQRQKQATKFHNLAQRHSSRLRRRLKRTSKTIEERLTPNGNGRVMGKPVSANISAAVLTLLSNLKEPARLNRSNLHEYRLKVKQLRNLLQMAENSDQQPFIARLGQLKDAIGEWHDWEVLIEIAHDAVDHGRNCRLVEKLKTTAAAKFEIALRLAETIRRHDLRMSTSKSRARGIHPAEQVWNAAASLTT